MAETCIVGSGHQALPILAQGKVTASSRITSRKSVDPSKSVTKVMSAVGRKRKSGNTTQIGSTSTKSRKQGNNNQNHLNASAHVKKSLRSNTVSVTVISTDTPDKDASLNVGGSSCGKANTRRCRNGSLSSSVKCTRNNSRNIKYSAPTCSSTSLHNNNFDCHRPIHSCSFKKDNPSQKFAKLTNTEQSENKNRKSRAAQKSKKIYSLRRRSLRSNSQAAVVSGLPYKNTTTLTVGGVSDRKGKRPVSTSSSFWSSNEIQGDYNRVKGLKVGGNGIRSMSKTVTNIATASMLDRTDIGCVAIPKHRKRVNKSMNGPTPTKKSKPSTSAQQTSGNRTSRRKINKRSTAKNSKAFTSSLSVRKKKSSQMTNTRKITVQKPPPQTVNQVIPRNCRREQNLPKIFNPFYARRSARLTKTPPCARCNSMQADTMADNSMEIPAPLDCSHVECIQAYIYDHLMSNTLLSEEDLRSSLHHVLNTRMCIATAECACYQTLTRKLYSETQSDDISMMIRNGRCPCLRNPGDYRDMYRHYVVFRHTHIAAACGKRLFLEQLLEHGCDLEARTLDPYWTPLVYAVRNNNIDCIDLILNYTQRNLPELSKNRKSKYDDEDDDFELDDCLAMLPFAVELEPYTLQRLFDSGRCFIPKDTGYRKFSLCHLFIQTLDHMSCPNRQSLRILLDAGADLNAPDDRGYTVLCYAIAKGHEEIVDLLLEFGASPNFFTSEPNRYPGVVIATVTEQSAILRSLIKHGACVNDKSSDNFTALHLAAFRGQLEAVDILIEANALVDERLKNSNTPLSLAAHRNHQAIVKRLLELGSCNVNNVDNELNTPLIHATFNDNVEMVDMLLKHGADPHMSNSHMSTPLWNAVYKNSVQNVRRLLCCNVEMEVCSVGIDYDDEHGQHICRHPQSPLWIAIVIHASREIIQLLLQAAYNLQNETWLYTDGTLATAEWNINSADQDLIDDLLPFVRCHGSKPLSLLNICSRFFRSTFRRNLKNVTEHLPIPATLRAHLNLEFL